MSKRAFILIAFLFLAVSVVFTGFSKPKAEEPDGEKISLTTYYPAPYGVYKDLIITNTVVLGDVDGDGKVTNADMAVDINGDPLPGSLALSGSLGIGTREPRENLDVVGTALLEGQVNIGAPGVGYELPVAEGKKGDCLKSDGAGKAVWIPCWCPPENVVLGESRINQLAGSEGAGLPVADDSEQTRADNTTAKHLCELEGYTKVDAIKTKQWVSCTDNWVWYYTNASGWQRQNSCAVGGIRTISLSCSGLKEPCF
ncbi:MAG: hypothetical protein ABH872_01490 [Candidatus Omnitrophota bacterium]